MVAPASSLWPAHSAAAATGGRAGGEWCAAGVSIDSRTLGAGDLFVALVGPQFDGHDFVADALRKGACAAVVSRVPEDVASDAPLVGVADTQKALEALLASLARARERLADRNSKRAPPGLKVAPARLVGPCVTQVFYDDAWHLYDGDMPSLYLLRDHETIAGQQDLVRDHDLIKRTPADGMVGGLAQVNGDLFSEAQSRCVVMSYDYTVLAGTQGQQNHRKKDRMFEIALKSRLPLVFFTEGGGGRPGDTDGVGVAGLDCMAFNYFGQLSGLVPLVGIAYDTLRIAAVISSRLGLKGQDAVKGLQSSEGFPGLTGHVRFEPDGIGDKTLDLFTVQDGQAVPAN